MITHLEWLLQVITLIGILDDLRDRVSLLTEGLEGLFPLLGHVCY